MQGHHDDLQGKDAESDYRPHLPITGIMQSLRPDAEVWTVLLFGIYQKIDKEQYYENYTQKP